MRRRGYTPLIRMGTRWAVVLLMLGWCAVEAGAARWREHSFGVSFQPPGGVEVDDRAGMDAIMRMPLGGSAVVELTIKAGAVELTIEEVLIEAVHQIAGAHPSASILEQKTRPIAERPGGVIYFLIPGGKGGAFVLGQCFIKLGPKSVAVFQLEVDRGEFETGRETFESVIASVRVEDPAALQARRAAQLARGAAWLEKLTAHDTHQVLLGERWYRIVRGDTDAGYRVVTDERVEQLGLPGVRVKTRTRVHAGQTVYDSSSSFFLSDDGEQELWSIKTTARRLSDKQPKPDKGGLPGKRAVSWAETGVRSGQTITVTYETPSGVNHSRSKRPGRGYVSQVQLQLIDRLIEPDLTEPMGFYSYSAEGKRVNFTTVVAAGSDEGAYEVRVRADPERGERVSVIGPYRGVLRCVLPSGMVMIPTSKAALELTWGLD